MSVDHLSAQRCRACEGGITALDAATCQSRLSSLAGWLLLDGAIEKTFIFSDHYEAMAFVNAVAWISHRENHHPETTVGYRDVRVRYWTHAIGGLSDNDFICAAKIEKLRDI